MTVTCWTQRCFLTVEVCVQISLWLIVTCQQSSSSLVKVKDSQMEHALVSLHFFYPICTAWHSGKSVRWGKPRGCMGAWQRVATVNLNKYHEWTTCMWGLSWEMERGGGVTQNISLVLPSIKAPEAILAERDLNFPGDGLTQSIITRRGVFIF